MICSWLIFAWNHLNDLPATLFGESWRAVRMHSCNLLTRLILSLISCFCSRESLSQSLDFSHLILNLFLKTFSLLLPQCFNLDKFLFKLLHCLVVPSLLADSRSTLGHQYFKLRQKIHQKLLTILTMVLVLLSLH